MIAQLTLKRIQCKRAEKRDIPERSFFPIQCWLDLRDDLELWRWAGEEGDRKSYGSSSEDQIWQGWWSVNFPSRLEF